MPQKPPKPTPTLLSRFGTDGMRGVANGVAINPETLVRLGMAVGHCLRRDDHALRATIGKDTRLSGYMIESSLAAGLTAAGADVYLLGPVPSPAIALLTRSLRADFGIMITASHNAHEDNGVKFFSPTGDKFDDATLAAVERKLDAADDDLRVEAAKIGRARRVDDARARYIEYVKQGFPRRLTLDGMRIALDCANGANYRAAPTLLWELGGEIIPLGVEPNGLNINLNCGSQHPQAMCARVRELRADIGIAFDGDGDRVAFCDENGVMLLAEHALAAMALDDRERNGSDVVVATEIADPALDLFLAQHGIRVERCPVGENHVVAAMKKNGARLGVEPSGHFVLLDNASTSDGLSAALRLLAILRSSEQKAGAFLRLFTPTPQRCLNIPCSGAAPLHGDPVRDAVEKQRKRLRAEGGALAVRASGTEPVIRIVAQCRDKRALDAAIHELVAVLNDAGIGGGGGGGGGAGG